jgi:hypothetical protein
LSRIYHTDLIKDSSEWLVARQEIETEQQQENLLLGCLERTAISDHTGQMQGEGVG